MAQNMRDRGFSSSMDGYNQKKKKEQQAPVSTLRAAQLPKSTQQKPDTTAQKKQTAAGIPVSAQRMSSAANGRAAAAYPDKLSEQEFNRSTAMQKSYGNYNNYLLGRRVTSSGFFSRPDVPQQLQLLGDRAEQYKAMYLTHADAAGKAKTAFQNGQKSRNEMQLNAFGLTLPAQEVSRTRLELDFYQHQREAQKAYQSYIDTYNSYQSLVEKYKELDGQWWENIPPLEDAERERADKQKEIDALNEAYTQNQNEVAAYARMAGTPGAANKDYIMEQILNKQEEGKRIQAQIDQKRGDLDLYNEQVEYARLKKWKGFADQKVPDSARRANEKGFAYNIVDQEYTALDKALAPLAGLMNPESDHEANLAWMYDEEKRTYQKIYENYGPELAAQYLKELETLSLNTRRRAKEEEIVRNLARKPVVGYILNNLTTLVSPLKVGEYLIQGLDMLDGEMQKDAGYNRISYLSNAIRDEWGKAANKAGDKIFKTEGSQAGAFLYQTYMSMGDFLFNMALTGGMNVDKAGLAAYEAGERSAQAVNAWKAYKTAERLSLSLMGTQAAADAVLEAKDRGLDDGQAFALGTLAGAFEVLTEKVSIENLMEGIGNRSKLLYILKNVLAEGSEEGASDILNNVADVLISKDQSEWHQAILRYKREHPDASDEEAFQAVANAQAQQIGLSMLGGAISGGFMAGGQMMMGRMEMNAQMRDTPANEAELRSILDRGLSSDHNSKAYELSEELQGRLDRGETVSEMDALRAARAVDRAFTKDLQSKSAEAVGRRLVTDDGRPALDMAINLVEANGNRYMQEMAARLRTQETVDVREAGQVYLEAMRLMNEQQEDRTLTPREVTADMTELEKSAARAGVSERDTARMQRTADALGREVRFYNRDAESYVRDGKRYTSTQNGYYDRESGIIYVNAQAKNQFMQVVSHELTHNLEGTESYGALQEMILGRLENLDQRIQDKIESYARQGVNLDEDGAKYELTAEYVENTLLGDERTIRETVRKNRSLGEWVRDQIDRILAKLGNAEEQAAAKERQELRRIRDIYAQALRERSENKETAADSQRDGKQYSIEELEDGTKFVEVNVNQEQFDGMTGRELQAEVQRQINYRLKNGNLDTEVGTKYTAALGERTAGEYTHPKGRMAHDMFVAKLRASTELDHLLDASRYIAHKADDGHHPEATGGWDYFSTLFRVNGQMYRGRINIMVTDDGPIFYDVTHLSRTQKGTTESIFGDTRPRAASPKSPLGGVEKSVSQDEPEVKDLSLPAEGAVQSSLTEEAEGVKDLSLPKVGEEQSYTEDNESLQKYGIEIDPASGAAKQYSYSTAPHTEEEIGDAVARLVSAGHDGNDAERWIRSMQEVSSVILTNMMYLDYESDERYSWLKKNSDYTQGSVDFNNNCPKRAQFTAIFDSLQKLLPNKVFTASEYEQIRQIMIKHGVPVTCGPCFVEDRRQHTGEIAQKFIDSLKDGSLANKFRQKVGGDTYVPTQYDLTTYEGLKALYNEHRGVHDAFVAFNNARGMAAARLLEGMAEYNNQIKKWNRRTVNSKNSKGGLRIFSLSDADPRNMIDIIQIVTDAAEKGLMIQGYTKKAWFARMVKDTGMRILRSHIPAGNGVLNGKLAFDNVEGINTKDPDYFDATNEPNIGDNVIGINDEMIRVAMQDPDIDQIIPFHSSLAKAIRDQKKIGHWQNYRDSQTDKDNATGRVADKQVNIYKDVIDAWKAKGTPITNKVEFVKAFLQVCEERGLTPRFAQFLKTDENGSYIYTPGYEKFLVDYKLFDRTTGEIIPQAAVVPEFDDEFNKRILSDYVKSAKNLPAVDQAALDEVLEHFTGGKQFSYSEDEGTTDLSLPKIEAGDGEHIYRDAPENYRYNVLKDKTLTVRSYDTEKLKDVDLSKFETLNRTETEKLLRKIGEQFGVFKKYRTQDVAVEFQFSRNNLGESVHKQGGRYGDYAKMLTVFDDVIENAVGIETHSERYANKRSNLKQMFVLASAFKTEDGVIPVLMEVKEFTDGRQNTLHLTVSLNAIAEADIVAYAGGQDTQATAYTPSASEYRIADIFQNVNVEDGNLLKYIPDGFLTDEQRVAKKKALERTERYIQGKNQRYQSSYTETEVKDLGLPMIGEPEQQSTEEPEVKDLGLPKIEAEETEETKKPKTRKKPPKPVAESKPIMARGWLNKKIMDSFGIRENKTEVSKIIQQYADKVLREGAATDVDVGNLFGQLYDRGVFEIFPDGYSKAMRELVTGGNIYTTESVKAEFGDDWADFRRKAFDAGLMLTNTRSISNTKTLGVDQIYKELSDMSPGLFPADEYDQRAMLEKIVQAAENGKSQKMTLPEYLDYMNKTEGQDMFEAAENMMDRIAEDLRAFGEMAGLEIKLRDRTGVKIAQERERFGEIREKHFQRISDARAQERERFREIQQRARERKQLSELRHKYLKSLQWLKKNQFRAPEELRDTWNELLGDMDLYAVFAAKETGMYDEEKGITIGDALNIYAAAKETENFLPSSELEKLWARVHGEHVGDLDIDELQARYQAITALRTEFYNRNRVLGEAENMLFSDVYDGVQADMARVGRQVDGKTHILRKMMNDEMLTPMNMLRRMVGWNKNSTFVSMARQLEQGERTYRRFKEQAAQLLDRFMQENADWVRKADGTGKDGIWHTFEVPELLAIELGNHAEYGETVTIEMTPLQLVQLYLESKSYDNLRHIAKGGRTFADRALWQAGNKNDGKFGKTVKLSPETVKGIVKTMTPQEMELAKLLEHYYNVWSKPQINRVSNALDGFDKAMTGAYAPMHVNQDVVKQEIGTKDIRAKSVPNMKSRIKGAVAATFNTDALEAWQQSVEDSAKYVGYAIAERNWNCMMNYWTEGRMMRDVIRSTWGSEGVNYITKTVENLLSRGERSGKFVLGESTSKLLSNYIAATFGANPGIVLKQSASLPQFAAILGWNTLPSPKQIARINDDVINAYTSELAYRKRGYATPETAQLKNTAGKLKTNKVLNFTFGGGAIIAMDAATVRTSWAWAENYVKRNFPELSMGTDEQIRKGESEFYKKVAEIFEDAVNTTQPMYDEMHRAGIMKDSNGIMRAFTMFKTVPLQQYNTLRRLFGELSYAQEAFKADASEENKAALRQAQKGAANAVTATVGSVLMLEAVELLNALWKNRGKKYRDDEDKLTAGSIAGNVALKALQDTAGMVIGGKELTEWIGNLLTGKKWYGIEIPGGEQLNDFIDAIGNAAKGIYNFVAGGFDVIRNGENFGLYLKRHAGEYAGAAKELAEKTAMYFGGLPVANVEKYIMGGVQFFPEISQAVENVFTDVKKDDLKGKTGKELQRSMKDLFDIRGVELSEEAARAVAALYEGGSTGAAPTNTPTSISIDGEEVKLSEAQKQRWERTWAETVRSVNELVASKDYQNADEETRCRMLNKLYELAKIEANMTMPGWTTDEKLPEKAGEIINAGGTAAQAAAWFGLANNASDAEKFGALADMNISEDLKEAIFRTEKGAELETESGDMSAYGKLIAAKESGAEVSTYLRWLSDKGSKGDKSSGEKYEALADGQYTDAEKEALLPFVTDVKTEDGLQAVKEDWQYAKNRGLKIDTYLRWKSSAAGLTKDEERFAALAESDMSDTEKAAIAGTLFSNRERTGKNGDLTNYGQMMEWLNDGVPIDDYLTARANDALTEYGKTAKVGLPAEDRVAAAVAAHTCKEQTLEQKPDAEWWDFVLAARTSDNETKVKVGMMAALMDESDFLKWKACWSFVGAGEYALAKAQHDAILDREEAETGKRPSTNQTNVKAALDLLDLPTESKAYLFQMFNKSWKTGKNPYSSSAGAVAYNALHADDASEEPEGLSLPYIP